jgi:HSP20 family protein
MTTETRTVGNPEVVTPKVRTEKKALARAVTPFDEFDRMMDRLMEGWMPRGWLRPFHFERPLLAEFGVENWMPKVDVIDRDEEVLLRAQVPGVEKKDLDITVAENMVTLKGETRHEEKEEQGDFYRREITRGSFARTIGLPAEVDPEKAVAEFKEGVLELKLPKLAHARRHTLTLE